MGFARINAANAVIAKCRHFGRPLARLHLVDWKFCWIFAYRTHIVEMSVSYRSTGGLASSQGYRVRVAPLVLAAAPRFLPLWEPPTHTHIHIFVCVCVCVMCVCVRVSFRTKCVVANQWLKKKRPVYVYQWPKKKRSVMRTNGWRKKDLRCGPMAGKKLAVNTFDPCESEMWEESKRTHSL